MLVTDSMVLIHLAKTSLLASACKLYGGVFMPRGVYHEVVVVGREKGFADAVLVDELVDAKQITVEDIAKSESARLKLLDKYGIRGGESEAVALALKKNLVLACDDDSVRSKAHVLQLTVVGTLPILVDLHKRGKVPKEKILQAVSVLRKVGWFSNAVLDQVILEVS